MKNARVFAIGDLHLSSIGDKPMDIFGAYWRNHWERIRESWISEVTDRDIVLIPGDISWAMKLEEALPDIALMAELPGTKVITRGNHDYWWGSIGKIRAALPEGFFALQNDGVCIDGLGICGTRGWTCPGGADFSAEDEKIYRRELGRLEMSISDLAKKGCAPAIAMIHYPPFNERREQSGFMDIFERNGITRVVYAHLHGRATANAFEGVINGVEYTLVSCDHMGFKVKRIL